MDRETAFWSGLADEYSHCTYYVTRFAPWLLPLLDRRMQAESIKAGKRAD